MRTGDATLTKNLLVRKMPVVTTVVSVQKRKAFPLWFLNKILFLHVLCIMIIISCFKSRVCIGCYCEVVCRRTFNRLKCQIYRGQPTSNKWFFFPFSFIDWSVLFWQSQNSLFSVFYRTFIGYIYFGRPTFGITELLSLEIV